jgi:hypothetical protein
MESSGYLNEIGHDKVAAKAEGLGIVHSESGVKLRSVWKNCSVCRRTRLAALVLKRRKKGSSKSPKIKRGKEWS